MEGLSFIGAGLMSIAFGCVALALGNIFKAFIEGAFRNPDAAPRIFNRLLLGFALTEAIALFALVLGVLIIYA